MFNLTNSKDRSQKAGLARSRTWVLRIRISCDNRYTTRPYINIITTLIYTKLVSIATENLNVLPPQAAQLSAPLVLDLHLQPNYPHMSVNPSHILIARNSRGLNNPSATLSSPTETHAAAAGIFRSAGSPPLYLEECETDDSVSDLGSDEFDNTIDMDPTFTKGAPFPGNVKIIVENSTFW